MNRFFITALFFVPMILAGQTLMEKGGQGGLSMHTSFVSHEKAQNELPYEEPSGFPLGVEVREVENELELTWLPVSSVESYILDNGKVSNGISLNGTGTRALIGTAFRSVRVLSRISWFLYEKTVQGDNRKIALYVFDLDQQGRPSSKVLYKNEDISCKASEASFIDLAQPLQTPNGCYVGLVPLDGKSLSLGTTDGEDEAAPYKYNTYYMTADYQMYGFQTGEYYGLADNLCIRCYGLPASVAEPDDAAYKIWRFEQSQAQEENQWSLLAEVSDTLRYRDASFSTLPMGIYRYVVETGSGEDRKQGFSAWQYKDMYTSVRLMVEAGTTGEPLEGAVVTFRWKSDGMEESQPTYSVQVPSNGLVEFPSVLKGKYVMEILYSGFETLTEEVVLDTEDTYDLGKRVLSEYIDQPWGVKVEKMAEPFSREIRWNGYEMWYDDVEAHPDFAINSSGELGWSYIDGDGAKPYGIQNCTFPNMMQPLSYMAFNSSKTTPSMSNLPAAIAHSGVKYFAAFANMPASANQNPERNDDYIISPKLEFEGTVSFDFWAKSYHSDYSESFIVKYSTSGKEKEDFQYNLSEEVIAPGQWTHYSYMVPEEATYVAIHHISLDKFIFMLDDLKITEVPSLAVPLSFEITLDGKVIDTVEETIYTFTSLASGQHTIGIRSLYKTGDSPKTETTFMVDDRPVSFSAKVTDDSGSPVKDAKVKLQGDFVYESVTDVEGKVTLDKLQGNAEYELTVEALSFKLYREKVVLEENDVDGGVIVLSDEPQKPGLVRASVSNSNELTVDWEKPGNYRIFRSDDGVIAGGVGNNMGTDKTVVGAVYRDETKLYSISWMTAIQGENKINLFVFDLDNSGLPVKKILFSQEKVRNIGMQWNTFYLDEPLNCPNGFMLGISGDGVGNVGLGADSGEDSIWPFVPKRNYLIQDYTAEDQYFNLLDNQIPRNLMIRAEGSLDLSSKNAPKSISGYKVFRAAVDTQGVQEGWQEVTSSVISQTQWEDKGWEQLEKGWYRYAVQTVYSTGDTSVKALSAVVGNRISTVVSVSVIDENAQAVEGAKVELLGEGPVNYTLNTDAAGSVLFEGLPTGVFTLQIIKEGYADFIIRSMDFTREPSYKVGPFVLQDPMAAPTGLKAEKLQEEGNVLLSWNPVSSEETKSGLFVEKGGDKSFAIYEVSVDGNPVGETADTVYRLSGLEPGIHTVGVRVRKGNSYSPSTEVSVEISGMGTEEYGRVDVRIYPNPASDGRFTIESQQEISSLQVYDLQGRRIAFRESGNGFIRMVEVDPDFSGMALVRVSCGQKSWMEKVIVK